MCLNKIFPMNCCLKSVFTLCIWPIAERGRRQPCWRERQNCHELAAIIRMSSWLHFHLFDVFFLFLHSFLWVCMEWKSYPRPDSQTKHVFRPGVHVINYTDVQLCVLGEQRGLSQNCYGRIPQPSQIWMKRQILYCVCASRRGIFEHSMGNGNLEFLGGPVGSPPYGSVSALVSRELN